jgi:transcriptional regulator with XRE-family HTH domain
VQDEIAYQLRSARKKRKLTQPELEKISGMKQSAISRIEQASYSRWNFKTLLRLADALDVRMRFTLDYAEDVIREYEQLENRVSAFEYTDSAANSQAAMENQTTRTSFLRGESIPIANVEPRIVSGSFVPEVPSHG